MLAFKHLFTFLKQVLPLIIMVIVRLLWVSGKDDFIVSDEYNVLKTLKLNKPSQLNDVYSIGKIG
jgi:hypothetical protein